MKKLLACILALAMIFALTACGGSGDSGSADEKQVWKVAAMGSETNPVTLGWYDFEKAIEEKLPNVDVQVFINGQLGTSTDDCIGGLLNGIIQFSDISTGNVTEFSSAFTPLDQPFLFNDRDTALAAVSGEAGALMAGQFDKDAGVTTLGYWDYGFREMTNSKKEIKSKADMDGLKIRTLTSDVYVNMISAMGASPTSMAYSEVFTGLQQGTIDGQENPLSTIVDAGFYEANKYVSMTDHVYGFLGFFCGSAWFNGLDAETQAIVKECAATALEAQYGYAEKANNDAMAVLEGAGCTITKCSDEAKNEWREACSGLWEQCKANCDAAFGADYYTTIMKAAGR